MEGYINLYYNSNMPVFRWPKIKVMLLLVIILGVTGCTYQISSSLKQPYKSFRDIPNITAEEVSAIESLKKSNPSFVYGVTNTTEAFTDSEGVIKGFAPLFCRWLSELFEIPFNPAYYTRGELLDGLKNGLVDFTGELTPAGERRQIYYMTDGIIHRWLCYFRLEGADPLQEIAAKRPLKFALFEESAYVKDIFLYAEDEFERIIITEFSEVYELLKTGEADAFITENTAEAFFDAYSDITMENFYPFIDSPVSLSTQKDELVPVISVVQKALEDGAGRYLYELYNQGYNEYKKHKLWMKLTKDEIEYIKTNPVIPFVAEYDNYPLSFYNTRIHQWQGASLDVLKEVEILTGLEFELVNDEQTEWHELLQMLETGKALFVTELLRTEEREGRFLWPDTAIAFNRPALLSMADYDNININKVPAVKVGIQRGTAYVELFRSWFPNHGNVIIYESQSAYHNALLNGEVDMVMGSYNSMLYLTTYLERVDIKLNILFEYITESTFGFHRDAEVLCSIFNKALELIDTGIISDQWATKTYDYRAKVAEARLPWLLGAIVLSLTVLVLVIINFYRRQRVTKVSLEANQNLQAILEILPLGIFVISRIDGSVLYYNKTAADMYQSQNANLSNKKRSIFDFMPEFQHDGRRSIDVITELSINESGVVETQNCKLSGETFWTRTAYRSINYNGINATLNAIEDITAERERQQMLESIALKEQEANQLKSRFLAKMSHEIRTPMNAIIGMSELALREDNIDTIKMHVGTVKQSGVNLLSIINDILDFSKIESGKLEIINTEYSLSSLVNDIINIIRIKIIKTHLRFSVMIDSNIPHTLIGDESRIRQILINLLSNAVKYTDTGFVSLFISGRIIDNGAVELSIQVEDSGIGIKEEDLESLFKDFTQLDTDRNKGIEGIGLGLAISDNIIRAMNGSIKVKSEYGKGSTFTVTLPQKYKTNEPLAKVEDSRRISILVYERRKPNISSIVFAIDNLGIDYTAVSDDAQLHEKMSANKYEFLFIPYSLFEKNKETIQKSGQFTRVVLLSEYGESIYDKDMDAVTTPVYCVPVANILNGAPKKNNFDNADESGLSFTAPEAKILVVDDLYTNLHVAQGLMKQYNMKIDLCSSGMAALDAAKAVRYDLIFMDHRMPGMDGIEATKRIRELGAKDSYFKNIPIIALTANAVSGTKEMFIQNGFNDFLSKPIETAKLHEILEKWIPKEKQIYS